MNQHAPIIPPNSPLARPEKERRSSFRVLVFVVLALNLVLLVGLLIQGCEHLALGGDTAGASAANAPSLPATNPPIVMQFLAPPPVSKTCSVVKGDSFYEIAHANGISMSALVTANPGVDSAKLKLGEVLQLPPTTRPARASLPTAAAPVTITATANHSPDTHVVRSGDALAKIAGVHPTTSKALRVANGSRTRTLSLWDKSSKFRNPARQPPPTCATPPASYEQEL